MSGERPPMSEIDPTGSVLVVKEDRRFPFSKGLMAMSLMSSGLSPDRSYELATTIERELQSRGRLDIPSRELSQLAEEVLAAEEDELAVRHFRQWRRLDHLHRPLILM